MNTTLSMKYNNAGRLAGENCRGKCGLLCIIQYFLSTLPKYQSYLLHLLMHAEQWSVTTLVANQLIRKRTLMPQFTLDVSYAWHFHPIFLDWHCNWVPCQICKAFIYFFHLVSLTPALLQLQTYYYFYYYNFCNALTFRSQNSRDAANQKKRHVSYWTFLLAHS